MKIIIEVKDTARLDRIDSLSKSLDYLKSEEHQDIKDRAVIDGFGDVIKSISKEW